MPRNGQSRTVYRPRNYSLRLPRRYLLGILRAFALLQQSFWGQGCVWNRIVWLLVVPNQKSGFSNCLWCQVLWLECFLVFNLSLWPFGTYRCWSCWCCNLIQAPGRETRYQVVKFSRSHCHSDTTMTDIVHGTLPLLANWTVYGGGLPLSTMNDLGLNPSWIVLLISTSLALSWSPYSSCAEKYLLKGLRTSKPAGSFTDWSSVELVSVYTLLGNLNARHSLYALGSGITMFTFFSAAFRPLLPC